MAFYVPYFIWSCSSQFPAVPPGKVQPMYALMISMPVEVSTTGILIGALIVLSGYIAWQMYTIDKLDTDNRRLRKLADKNEALIDRLERENSAAAAELAVAVAARVEAEGRFDFLAMRLSRENRAASDHAAQAMEYGVGISAQDPQTHGLPTGRMLHSI